MIVAIDGTAASGKGTLAKGLARRLGLAHLDTGSLYRRVALEVLQSGGDPEDPATATAAARAIAPASADDDALRSDAVGQAASQVAAIATVRATLLEFQRQFARQPGGAVLDGRDIGTVVCPDADHKFFIEASLEERARRRTSDLAGRGIPQPYEQVLAEMKVRDERDRNRATSPMVKADDAMLIMTDGKSAGQVLELALAVIEGRPAS